MAERIPQSATIRVPLQAYLSSDHVSAATGKTIAITISRNGAAYGNPSAGATNATEIASGSYYVDLSTTDTGTTGPLFVLGTAASTDNVVAIYNVVNDQPQTGDAYARLGAPAGASVSADIAAVKSDSAAVKVQTDKLSFTVANQIDANVLDWKSATAPAMTGDAFARLGAPAGASHAADVAAVKTDTAAVKVQTDKLTFSVANQVDTNIKSVAGTTVNGAGTAGSPWGP